MKVGGFSFPLDDLPESEPLVNGGGMNVGGTSFRAPNSGGGVKSGGFSFLIAGGMKEGGRSDAEFRSSGVEPGGAFGLNAKTGYDS